MKHAGKETATGNVLPANMEIGELIQQNTCSPSEVKCVDCNLIYINSDLFTSTKKEKWCNKILASLQM